MKIDGCSALVTGASAGIGREFARALAGRAKTLVLVARREERLIELANELRGRAEVHTRVVDLAEKAQIDALVDWLGERKIDIDLLINNAGLGDYGSFATSDPRRNEQIVQVNISAVLSLTRGLLPQMIARKGGGILNVSSSASFLPIPDMNVYAASKAFVSSFSEALGAELSGTGVTVTALCPGPVHTEFADVAKRPSGKLESAPDFVYVSAEKTVRDALAAIEARRAIVIPGAAMKIGMAIVRAMPMSILRFGMRFRAKRGRE